jgi:predicted nucleic acid-binding protein
MAPASWAAELANVVWAVTRAGAISSADALERLRVASQLGIDSVDVTTLWAGAVSRAIDVDHPAYDTLFVELAHRRSVPLATFDQRVLDVFDDVAVRPGRLVP